MTTESHLICFWRQRNVIIVVAILAELLTTASCTTSLLKCSTGNDVSFECPCCPEEFGDCRFKKLFQGGYIVRDGKLSDHLKYGLGEHRTNVTLKECHEDDEGTYVWMCGRCNVNKQFHLEVEKHINLSIKCSMGDEISFGCPCCPDELDSCRFKKLEQEGYIVRDGLLSHHHPRFEFDEHKTHITLKECNEDDKGTYVWMCGKCNKHFSLDITYEEPIETSSSSHQMISVRISTAVTLYIFTIYLMESL